MEIIFLDVETQNTFTYGEEFKVDQLKISYLGLIDGAEKEHDFWESDMQKLDDLLAKADFITKLHAICVKCGNIANYSYRKSTQEGQVVLGEKDIYEPRCRNCYQHKD